jgi:hypothetical protein
VRTSVPTPSPVLSPDQCDDPSTALEAATWALAALIGTLDDVATRRPSDVLAANPQRTAVLEVVGLIRRDGGTLTLHPSYEYPDGPTARRTAVRRRRV